MNTKQLYSQYSKTFELIEENIKTFYNLWLAVTSFISL